MISIPIRFRVALLFMAVICCASLAIADTCPANYERRDRAAIQNKILTPAILYLIEMHELSLDVASAAMPDYMSSAYNSQYQSLLNSFNQAWAQSSAFHLKTNVWLASVRANGFSDLKKTRIDDSGVATSAQNAISAIRLVASALAQIGECD